MRFKCKICDKSFKKFVLFEGHFDFSDKCREKQNTFIECYVCNTNFRHYAALKFHIQQHTVKRAKKLTPIKKRPVPRPVIPKITLKKQWNFKTAPQDEAIATTNDQTNSPQLLCKICGQNFSSLFSLAQHSTVHGASEPDSSTQTNEKRKSENIATGAPSPTRPTAKLTVQSGNCSQSRNQCSVCKIVLRHGGARLERHMQFHIDGKFKCEICDIKFSRSSLGWHRKYFHPKYRMKKRILGKNRLQKKDIGQMSSIEKNKRRCKICRAVVKAGDVQHMRNHKTGKFKCEICNIRFSLLSLAWHQKRYHPEINPRTCTICKVTLSEPRQMRKHMLVHEIGKEKCEECNIRFTPHTLLIHQKKFHPDVPRLLSVKQPCDICKTICRSEAELDEHVDMHANGKVKCEEHQIRFTFEALQTHNKRWHTAKLSTTCPICKLKLSSASHLKQHKTVHLIGDVMCDICDIPFTSNSLLHHQKVFHRELFNEVVLSERHINRNLAEKMAAKRRQRQNILHSQRFQCTYCKLCFLDAKKREIHTAVHIDGDVECRICNIRFTKQSLLNHEKRFHQDVIRKERILKAVHRHLSDDLQALNELESKDIPVIVEDQYKQLLAANNSKDQCIICKLPCGDAKKLDTHVKVHIEGDYKCELCSVWFTKNSLDFHQKRFHPEFYEERISNGIKLMKEHCDYKENEFSEKKTHNDRVRCDICKVSVGGTERMDEHKRTHVDGDAECKICNIRFTVGALRYHQKLYHPSEVNQVPQEHKCTVCKLKFSDTKTLETHMTVHTEPDTQCDICNIPFTMPSLRYHMKRFHAKAFTTELLQKALQRNMMVETSANVQNALNKNQCPICNINCDGKKFDVHMKKVHIDGDVKCSVCQTWFTQPSLDYHYKRFHPDLYVAKENRHEVQHQCTVCKLVSYDEARLKEHMKVHLGNVRCPICSINFTKPSLVYHYKRFHPNLTKKERILKSIENSAPIKKNLHNCPKCGKSFTRICYLKLHIKYHRNAVEPVEIPFPFISGSPVGAQREPSELPLVFSTPLCGDPEPAELPLVFSPPCVEQNSDSGETNHSVASVKTRDYECYVCKLPFTIAEKLQDHVSKHIVYEQWMDPSNVYLSNWDPDELREIISEQPIVLVENLKLLADFGRPNKMSLEKRQDITENFAETDRRNSPTVKNDCNVAPDTTNCRDVVEILSDSDDDCETIQYQLNNNAKQQIPPEYLVAENYPNEPVYISSDDEDSCVVDIIDLFHCYFCNGRFLTLAQFGEHEKICHMKGEPDY